MKKLYLNLLFLLICGMINAQTIEKSYTFSKPNITTIQGYEQIQMEGCMQSAIAGQPCLPWQSVSLMLPEGQEAESIEVHLYDFQELEGNHTLFPYQPSRAYSDTKPHPFVKDEAVYNSKGVYPSQSKGQLSTQYLNGVGFAFSAFTPVQYEPATGKVSYATRATVTVTTKASRADHSQQLWMSPTNRARVQKLAQNPEMISNYQTRGREVTAYDLLIITGSSFISDFDEYCDYYNNIGLRNRIVSVDEIYSSTTGIDNQDKIRNYIIQEYQNNGIIMVVLGGDVDIVPYRGLYCHVTSGGGNQESTNLPADLYYSGLDGSWNDDNDDRWGEPGEDDLLPEIGISRLPFQNSTDLANMIHKTLSYQQTPVLGEFHKVILAGEHLYDNPVSNGSDYLELLIGTHSDNGYTTTCYPTNYDFTKLYEEEGNWSGSLLKQAINAGTSYVHHDGHANSSYVAGWYGISNDDFSGANGTTHNYTFFHSQGCDCGAFDETTCILEKMVRIQNFAVAVIGNSRYGWFNEGQTEGPGCHLEREMTDAQWNDRIGLLGCAISDGKCMTAPWVTAPGQWEEGALRWNFYDMNVLGDGACNVWLDEPFTASVDAPSQVVIGTQSIDVTVTDPNGNGLKNYRCLIYMENDVIAMGVTDENGVAEIAFEGGLQNVGNMIMKVSGVNSYPQDVELLAVPSNTPYVVYESYTLANGAQQIDFDGNYAFNLVLRNVGSVDATNVTATISCESEYITINETTADVGDVDGNLSITLENVFAFSVSDNVPNNTPVRFNITCTDGTDTWESHFNARVYAPEFELVRVMLESSDGQALSGGSSGTIHFVLKNSGGCAIPSVVFAIFNSHPEITVGETQWTYENVEAGDVFTADLEFTLGDNVQFGAMYELPYSAYYGQYILSDAYYIPVGQSVEDFETGDFSAFDWQSISPIYAWEVVNQNPYEGTYCARSSSIGNSEMTSLFITVRVAQESEVSFYYKVSSESNYDDLNFYIDGTVKGNWSGEVSWARAAYTLTAGTHELRWTYAKDASVSSGSDCAWIDNVSFPASTIITEVKEEVTSNVAIYPNPNNGNFTISLGEDVSTITVYNKLGQVVHQQGGVSGTTEMSLNLNAGMYFVNVKSDKANSTQIIIVK